MNTLKDIIKSKGDDTFERAIGVVIATTILIAIVACGVTFNWLGK